MKFLRANMQYFGITVLLSVFVYCIFLFTVYFRLSELESVILENWKDIVSESEKIEKLSIQISSGIRSELNDSEERMFQEELQAAKALSPRLVEKSIKHPVSFYMGTEALNKRIQAANVLLSLSDRKIALYRGGFFVQYRMNFLETQKRLCEKISDYELQVEMHTTIKKRWIIRPLTYTIEFAKFPRFMEICNRSKGWKSPLFLLSKECAYVFFSYAKPSNHYYSTSNSSCIRTTQVCRLQYNFHISHTSQAIARNPITKPIAIYPETIHSEESPRKTQAFAGIAPENNTRHTSNKAAGERKKEGYFIRKDEETTLLL